MSNHLAIDIGASSYRLIVSNGKEYKELARHNNHLVTKEGIKYWDITAIYNSIIKCLNSLKMQKFALDSLSINSFGCDFAALLDEYQFDDSGYLHTEILAECYLNGITNNDRLNIENKISSQELFNRTGINSQAFNTIYRASKLKGKVTFVASYLNYLLTNKLLIDPTIASTSQMYDLEYEVFNPVVLNKIGVNRDVFPSVEMPGKCVAPIVHKGYENIDVVFGAAHDTANAFYCYDEYTLVLNIGSWIICGLNVKSPKNYDANFNFERGLRSKYKVVSNIIGMNGFNQIIEECGLPRDYNSIAEMLEAMEVKKKIDIKELYISDNLSQQIDGEGSYHTLAIYLNSIAYETARMLMKLQGVSDKEISKLAIIGGGSNNKYFINRLMYYLEGKYEIVKGNEEATVEGNIKLQLEAKYEHHK